MIRSLPSLEVSIVRIEEFKWTPADDRESRLIAQPSAPTMLRIVRKLTWGTRSTGCTPETAVPPEWISNRVEPLEKQQNGDESLPDSSPFLR